jgi:proteic killer suppression protein
MIKTFANKETAAIFANRRVRSFDDQVVRAAQQKLAQLNRVERLEELRIPPGNRLEKLSGSREGQWSIRINDQWRICFEWREGHVWNVEIVEYH